MMLKLLFILVVCFSAAFTEVRITYKGSERILDDNDCYESDPCSPGLRCSSDCRSVELCIQTTPDNYTVCNADPCNENNENQFCDHDSQTCHEGENPCSNHPFECMGLGIFPDPYDCTQFYLCSEVGDQPDPIACQKGTTYNPARGHCTTEITQCYGHLPPVPRCYKMPQCAPLSSNPYISYLCMKDEYDAFYPILLNCDSGYFNSWNCVCDEVETLKNSHFHTIKKYVSNFVKYIF